jgi:dienelactone hydrolase
MTMLERLILVVTVAVMLLRHGNLGTGAVQSTAVAALAALCVLAAIANPARWQLLPVHAVAVALAVGLIWNVELAGASKHAALVIGLLFAAAAVGLAEGLPLRPLPAPTGPHAVGAVSLELERPTPAGEMSAPRRLLVKLWYPADAGHADGARESLWSELYEPGGAPAPMRWLASYLRKQRTHAMLSAAIAAEGGPYPLLVYSHALISFAAENTLLMEQLASDGFIVASVRHRDQLPEYEAIRKNIPAPETARDRELYGALGGDLSRSERARLSQELYANSTGMRTIVERRADDARFVADEVHRLAAAIPACAETACLRPERYGALGLSLGGAVATRLCSLDPRCAAVANLDGGLYGVDDPAALRGPYLMLSSEDNQGANDALKDRLGSLYTERALEATKHLDFHDAAVVAPILRWLGQLGPGRGRAVNRDKNRIVSDFFSAALRGRAAD